jgi:hypothetical protein
MSKQRILMIVAICFVLLGTVAAGRGRRSEPKPDSLVGCVGAPAGGGGVGRYVVQNLTVPASFDPIECFDALGPGPDFPPVAAGSTCTACIQSLEDQGCEILDVNLSLADGVPLTQGAVSTFPHAVFVLSCERH